MSGCIIRQASGQGDWGVPQFILGGGRGGGGTPLTSVTPGPSNKNPGSAPWKLTSFKCPALLKRSQLWSRDYV